jgi:hypothetical protein
MERGVVAGGADAGGASSGAMTMSDMASNTRLGRVMPPEGVLAVPVADSPLFVAKFRTAASVGLDVEEITPSGRLRLSRR